MRRARVFGDHPPRDKEHHLASPKCRRESTPQTVGSTTSGRRGVGGVDPLAQQRPQQRPYHRSPRPPELHRRPNQIHLEKKSRRRGRRTQHRGRQPCTAQAARAGRGASRRSSRSREWATNMVHARRQLHFCPWAGAALWRRVDLPCAFYRRARRRSRNTDRVMASVPICK